MKKKEFKKWVKAPFGDSDLDRLAHAIYREYHRGDQFHFAGDPWPLYTRQKHDVVVDWFRQAAATAISEHKHASQDGSEELDW